MRPGRLVDLMLAVRNAEAAARWPDFEGGVPSCWWPDRPATQIGRQAVVELHLWRFDDAQIDSMFGFPDGTSTSVLAAARIHPKAHEIIEAHLKGHSPSRISRDWSVGIPTINDILKSIGEEPNKVRNLAKSADVNLAVKRLYEQGASYREIADRLDITESNVRQRLQYMRRKGRIEGPPRDGRPPRAAD